MIHEARIVLDVSGEDKAGLTIEEIIRRFGVVDEKMVLER